MLALALAAATPARADTTWTGANSTNWFDIGNWNAILPAGGVNTTIDTIAPRFTVVAAPGAQAGTLDIGYNAVGTLFILSGGTVTNTTGAIGRIGGSLGTVTVDGPGSSWVNTVDLVVGSSGRGTLTVTNQGSVSSATGAIGNQTGSNGTVTVDGVGSNWTNAGFLIVGNSDTGTLAITNGGAVSNAAAFIGHQFTGGGAVTVDGAGSTWTNTGTVTVGNLGIGTLTIRAGGVVSAPDVVIAAGAIGTLNIGAGTGQAAVAPGTLITPTVAFGAGTGIIFFNHTSSNYAFTPAISGAGAVTVEAGTTILTAANTYTGATTVNGGTLTVNGSIANSAVAVNSTGRLGGTGTVGATQVNAGGSFAPGDGTANSSLNVAGSLTFQAASLYMVQVNPATASYANVTGNATLGGATVKATFAAGSYISKQYTILQATGTVGGSFNSTVINTNLPSNFHTSLSYDIHNAYLNLALNFVQPGFGIPTGLTTNQQNVGNALTNFFNSTGGIPIVFGSLTAAGLTQADGEVATGAQQATFNAMGAFLGLLTDPFKADRSDAVNAGPGATPFAERRDPAKAFAMFGKAPPRVSNEPRWSVWAAGFGGSQTTDGNATIGSNTATSRIYGTAVGADVRLSPNSIAGFALAGGGTNFAIANSLGTGRSDLFQAGAFVRHTAGPAYVTAALAYGWQDITTNRTVTIAGIDQLQARFNANAYSGRAEAGYRFVTPSIGITPYAAAQFTTFDLPAYAERAIVGGNAFALAYGSKSVTDSRSELGLRTDKSFALSNAVLTLRGRLAWSHDYNPDRIAAATFQTLPGASFIVNGATAARDAALVTASTEMKWLNGWSAAATFEGEFSNGTKSYAGKGVARYSW